MLVFKPFEVRELFTTYNWNSSKNISLNKSMKSWWWFLKSMKENCIRSASFLLHSIKTSQRDSSMNFAKFSFFILVAFPHQKLSGKCNQIKTFMDTKRNRNTKKRDLHNFPPCSLLVIHSFFCYVRSYFVSVIRYYIM